MKKIMVLSFIVCTTFIYSCQKQSEKLGAFRILPSPQQFEINGVSKLKYNDLSICYALQEFILPEGNDIFKNIRFEKKESKAQILCKIDASLDVKAEGYLLDIGERHITITGKDKAGLFYAFITLGQLMEDAKEQDVCLPVCSIKDWPSLNYRAIHLDVKHHIDKVDYYYKLIDKLAWYKVNAVIVELEDKLKFIHHPEIASDDALSINEWKKLSEYAKQRNIEISPLVQGLGHASFILKHNKYKNLRDDPQSDWAFNPLNPETYELQFDLYRDAMEAFSYGKYLHVGGDEVHTTGQGSGKSPLELQLIWLNKVCDFVEAHGRTPIFWDDMPLKHANVYKPMFDPGLTKKQVEKVWEDNEHKFAEFLGQFPRNCVYMRWNYRTPQALGNLKAMQWFSDNGMQVMGATAGQTRWVLMPQNESNIGSIKNFATISIDKNLRGLLLTLWDDDSPHFELYNRGIIAFAEFT